jgi:drug/metabolite transporter (DMT)-like permease
MSSIRPVPGMLSVVLWMSGALASFCLMATAVRVLSAKFSVVEILALRTFTGLVIVAAVVAWRPGRISELATRRYGLHLVRNAVHLGATYLWTLGVVLLPFATVFALEFTTPAWVALLAVLFLGERITLARLGAIALGFAGILVILRPGFETFRPATLIVLASAMGLAVSVVIQKSLTETDSTFCILAWMNAIQFALSAAGVLLVSRSSWLGGLTISDLPAVIGVGAGGFVGHYCMTNAFRSGDAVVVVPLDFLRIPLIAVIGFMFFGEPLDPFVFVGSGLIVGGILWNLYAESRPRLPDPGKAAGGA